MNYNMFAGRLNAFGTWKGNEWNNKDTIEDYKSRNYNEEPLWQVFNKWWVSSLN